MVNNSKFLQKLHDKLLWYSAWILAQSGDTSRIHCESFIVPEGPFAGDRFFRSLTRSLLRGRELGPCVCLTEDCNG